MSTARCAFINSLMRMKMRLCESSEKSSDSSFSAASEWAALSSRIAPRIVRSASIFAGSPASRVRSGTVAISIECRPIPPRATMWNCRRLLWESGSQPSMRRRRATLSAVRTYCAITIDEVLLMVISPRCQKGTPNEKLLVTLT